MTARYLRRAAGGIVGAAVAAIGLEEFLVPNRIIDGGIIGISIILSHILERPLGLLIVLLNAPFAAVGWRLLGWPFLVNMLISVSALGVFTTIAHPWPPVTRDPVLAAVFGGITLGIGVGLVIRARGALDGTEILAILGSRRLGFSVGELIMFGNIFILGSAGFVFGWDRAMYSLLAYFAAFKTIDVVLEGLDESKSVIIVSDKSEQVGSRIMTDLGRGVTYLDGRGGFTGEQRTLVYCIVPRLELPKLKDLVLEVDPAAFLAVENVHEVVGGHRGRRRSRMP